MFVHVEMGTGLADPRMEVLLNRQEDVAVATYTYHPSGGSEDGLFYGSDLLVDVADQLGGLVLDVSMDKFLDEEVPAVEVSVSVDGVADLSSEEELYARLLPITEVMNRIEVDSYIDYE